MTSGPEHPTVHAPDQQAYSVRRAPRLGAVLTVAALLGLVAAAIATAITHGGAAPVLDPSTGAPVSVTSTLGLMAVICLAAAALIGLLVWLVMDRRSRRTTQTVVLQRTEDPAEADVSLDRAEAEHLRALDTHGRTTDQ